MKAGRYHSLVAEPDALPDDLRANAWTEDGVLMAFEHCRLPVYGMQFHPESVLTEFGYEMLANFLRLAGMEVSMDLRELRSSELPPVAVKEQLLSTGPVTF